MVKSQQPKDRQPIWGLLHHWGKVYTVTQPTMRYLFLSLLALLFLAKTNAQNRSDSLSGLKLNEWQERLPWQRATHVTQNSQKVWFATEWAVVEVDKAERSPKFITKVQGLSDIGMNIVRYNALTENLLVVYSNSNLDLYKPADGSVINLPFIKKNQNIIGDKKVYAVAFDGKTAYLACGFGVVKMSLQTTDVEYTVFTGVPVRSFAVFGDGLYAGTEDGLFFLPKNDDNPADFSRWRSLGAAEGFPAGESVKAMVAWNGGLFAGIGKKVFRYDGSNPATEVAANADREINYLTAEGAGLMISWRKDFNGSIEYMEPSGNRYEISWQCNSGQPIHGIEDGTKKFWLADFAEQFRFVDLNPATPVCDNFRFNSPYEHGTTEISIGNGRVLASCLGANQFLGAISTRRGIDIVENGSWRRFHRGTNPELDQQNCTEAFWRVAAHPTEDKFYIGSFTQGLVEVDSDGQAKCYTKDNSILQDAGVAGTTRTAIGGLAFDKQNNLWISNYGAAAPIAVLKADGTLRNFSGAPRNLVLQIAIDQSGYKWFALGFQDGVMVYDSGKDLDSPADDRYKVFTTANSVLPTSTVSSVTVDLEGDVWVGTQQGAVSFECGSSVFEDNCTGRRRIVNVDGFNGYLLETEDVRTIAVDGANRKWFGTNNGIFVQSPDGLEQVARFTATNSPLFDNVVADIAIDPVNGEVWIATEKGIQTLRGEATSGGKVNSASPYAYPNPVRPDYDGPIAIYGLARDANVKITDVAGNLVYEGKALGGQAVWNGRDYLGRRAASGVYLVFATSSESFESPDAVITKVVVLN